VTWKNGNDQHSGKAQFYIKIEQKLPVLANRTSKGTFLTEDQFLTRWVDVTRYRGRFITDVNEAVGFVSSGFISAGRPLRPNDVTNPPIIDHGDQVTMLFTEKNMQVALEVTARSSASKHEQFRAYSTETRKTYLVKAIDPAHAEWIQTL
jgi:flagella basal body P-ring formation protein FlgA